MSPTAMGWVSVWGLLRGSFVYHLTGLQPQRSNEKLAQGQDINGDNKKGRGGWVRMVSLQGQA